MGEWLWHWEECDGVPDDPHAGRAPATMPASRADELLASFLASGVRCVRARVRPGVEGARVYQRLYNRSVNGVHGVRVARRGDWVYLERRDGE